MTRRATSHAGLSGGWLRPFGVALLAVCLTTPALALDRTEAQKVISVLETLHQETGRSVYFDEEAAAEWFEVDDEDAQRIKRAGFSADSWKRAYDETLTGFIAALPEAEFDRMFAALEQQVAALAPLSEEDRREARAAWQAEKGKLHAIRALGMPHVAVVTPYIGRLKKLTGAM